VRSLLAGAILTAILLWSLSADADDMSEADWTAQWCGERNMVYDDPREVGIPPDLVLRTPSGRSVRADCIDRDFVVEVDFAHKFNEGIGQALFYRQLSGREALLLLIVTRAKDCEYVLDASWAVWENNQRVKVETTGRACHGRRS